MDDAETPHVPMTPEEGLAQFAALERTMAELPDAMRMRIDRESRERLEGLHQGLPGVFRGTLQVSAAAFAAVKHLCYDRLHGCRPRADLSSAVPPLARTFLDSLICVVFVCDQPRANVERYYKGGLCAE